MVDIMLSSLVEGLDNRNFMKRSLRECPSPNSNPLNMCFPAINACNQGITLGAAIGDNDEHRVRE